MSSQGGSIGRYTLERLIATGGMAEIYLARQDSVLGVSREVVIKRIHERLSDDSDFVTMFLDEARLVALLSHPNVVSVLEFGQEGSSLYLVMEYIHGLSLEAVIEGTHGLTAEQSLRIAAELCAGLDYIHNLTDDAGKPLDVIHRDVNPQNVLLSTDGAVKLIDFGIAKTANKAHRTQTGLVKGRVAYLSPEQAQGNVAIDRRMDIHAVGVSLWEMLTGDRLFRRNTPYATLAAIVDDPVPSVRRSRPELPPEIDEVIALATAKEPDDRFQSCAELQKSLEELALRYGLASSAIDIGKTVRAVMARQGEEEADARPTVATPPSPNGDDDQGSIEREEPGLGDDDSLADPGAPQRSRDPIDERSFEEATNSPTGQFQDYIATRPDGVLMGPGGDAEPTTRRPVETDDEETLALSSSAPSIEDPARTPPLQAVDADDEETAAVPSSFSGDLESIETSPHIDALGSSDLPESPTTVLNPPSTLLEPPTVVREPPDAFHEQPTTVREPPSRPHPPRPSDAGSGQAPIHRGPPPWATPPASAPSAVTPTAGLNTTEARKGSGRWPLVALAAITVVALGTVAAIVIASMWWRPLSRETSAQARPTRTKAPLAATIPAPSPSPASAGQRSSSLGKAPNVSQPGGGADAQPPSPSLDTPSLSVSSDPAGATLWLDGNATREVTPLEDLPLDPGEHEVELVLQGYSRWRGKVVAREGLTVVLQATLVPTKAEGNISHRSTTSTPRKTGRLTLTTTPPARVLVKGRSLGTTPLRDVELPEGVYNLDFVLPDNERHRRIVRVDEGETAVRHFNFSRTTSW